MVAVCMKLYTGDLSLLRGFFFFLIKKNFWLRWVFIAARGLSLVVASGGLLFVAVHGLLIVVASLVVEHGL